MVNWRDDESLENWFEQIDLKCSSKAAIGLIGSMQFVGWAIASAILPRLSDIYGRKYILISSMVLQLASFIALFFSYNIHFTTGIMFFLGFSGVGRCSICFLLLMEFLPQAK
jgi:MFS family permease